jgi:SpoVK/Ycf46/Vps4 family AAA+-type ATPase
MRNSLVSIFLRVLEYFQGILFLTTNRVEIFDEAFQSRIHIALRYDNLDRKAQATIWSSFLHKVALEEIPADERNTKKTRDIITKNELDRICRRDLNGRQIKNAVRSAQVMAANLNEQLSFKHINMVLDITQAFEHDLKGTGQLDSMFILYLRLPRVD